ncbi:hypothetical protein JQ600_23910 [Bradyrhizobium sp. AUGA SZCCT0176]|uniref:hypothetical protein n=1 Tax=Bradyrhizobium sp. AUGA SZCCT0176 TaxID=2807664 RepID=UPI001BA9F12C|nr:hypothetical protein [Bradyrhizobium sp. AUGA SZCCT0176]MBR1227965.1 hypothetical protein [Bradyrhizobium sp. AUGA SZCCT0176]
MGPNVSSHHHTHGVIDIDQNLRHQVSRSGSIDHKMPGVNQRTRSSGKGLPGMDTYCIGEARACHRGAMLA